MNPDLLDRESTPDEVFEALGCKHSGYFIDGLAVMVDRVTLSQPTVSIEALAAIAREMK